MTFALVTIPLAFGLLFTYDVIKINWASNMEDQITIEAQQAASSCSAESVRFRGAQRAQGRPGRKAGARGREPRWKAWILYEQNCMLCHGEGGLGDGPITELDTDMRPPANLTEARMVTMSGQLALHHDLAGYGSMPPCARISPFGSAGTS